MDFNVINDLYGLSPMQKGMLFQTLFEPASGMYVEQRVFSLPADLDIPKFRRAWQTVVDRHSILRSSFHWEGQDEPLQAVQTGVRVDMTLEDWRTLSDDGRHERLDAFLHEDRIQGFDLSAAPLMRWTLIRMQEDAWTLCWTFHHILMDRWSTSLVLEEVQSLYKTFRVGTQADGKPARSFGEYISWLESRDSSGTKEFWEDALQGFAAPTALPFAPQAPKGASAPLLLEKASLSEEVTAQLQSLARRNQITVNTLIQGAWALLLHRYTGESDVLYGMVVAGRPADMEEVESMVGLFINTLPMRVQMDPAEPVMPWLKRMQMQIAEMREHEHAALLDIQGWSAVPRGVPMFSSLVAFQNTPGRQAESASPGELEFRTTKSVWRGETPISLLAAPGTNLSINLHYDPAYLDAAGAKRMLGHYRTLLEGIVTDAERPIASLPMLTEAERRQLLVPRNAADAVLAPSRCLHTLLAEWAERTPDAVAVVCEGQRLTYGQLNTRANRLAHCLRAQGVGPDVLVGLFLERSLEMIVGMFGILKAGGAYLPLDPAYPPERIAFMLSDAQAPVVLTQESLKAGLTACQARPLCLDTDWPLIEQQSPHVPSNPVAPSNLAYVIYTSGSTGLPKGVLVTHHNVVRLLESTEAWFHFDEHDVWTLFHSSAFDFSVWEIFGALLHGGRLVVVPYPVSRSPEEFCDLLHREKVTVLNQTPSAFYALIRAEEQSTASAPLALRYVIFGGEALELQRLKPWFDRHGDRTPQLVNMYGITETTVHVTYCPIGIADVERGAGSVIGVPIPDLTVYVLDAQRNPTPIGVCGEMYVGGSGVARGYLNRPDLTEERFIRDPFSAREGERLYKTGDLARRNADGSLEYLGRSDHQVKIRGFRIELGEIECRLREHPVVEDAVALVREAETGEKRLIAYLVGREAQVPSPGELRDHLRGSLPEYMLPSAFVMLETLPLTPNGKVDRNALPDPADHYVAEEVVVAPRTAVEEVLAGIWEEMLGIRQVSVEQDFFDLGGHSLMATRVVSWLREAFQVNLPLRCLFDHPTIRGLARQIEAARSAAPLRPVPPVVPVGREKPLPLSFAQQRLWLADQMEPGNHSYNAARAIRFEGPLNVPALHRAIEEILRRHEALRTTFPMEDGVPVQVVAEPGAPAFPICDLSDLSEMRKQADVTRMLSEESKRPFDLARGPLVRASLWKLTEQEHILVLVMHHIAIDRWSEGIFNHELEALYAAFSADLPSPLAPVKIQYPDYAVWERDWMQGEILLEQMDYWKRKLAGAPPQMKLPYDRAHPAVRTYEGIRVPFALDTALSAAIRELSRRSGTTLFMTLLTAFQILLYRYTGQETIVVGTDVANRNRPETESIFGCFVNQLVLCTGLSGDPTVLELLSRVREVCLEAYAHQDLPFDLLVANLTEGREVRSTPVFQTKFVLNTSAPSPFSLPGIKTTRMGTQRESAKFDLTLAIVDNEAAFRGTLEYNPSVFERATIVGMTDQFEQLLQVVVENPDISLSDLTALLARREREKQLLEQRNRELSSRKMFEKMRPRPIAAEG